MLGCEPSAQSQAIEHYNKGVDLSNEGKYDEAIVEYNQAIEIDQKFTQAYYNRGQAYFREKQYDSAIASLNMAIVLAPDDAEAYYLRGSSYYIKRQYNQAILDYTLAIKLDPADVQSFRYRGNAYREQGQSGQAIADYNRVIELVKGTEDAQYAAEQISKLEQAPIPTSVIPLTIDARWSLDTAYIVVEVDGTIRYQMTPQTLMAYGGSPLRGYTWSKPTMGRSFPPGTTVDINGVFKGTGVPLAEGTHTFDVQVSDGSSVATAPFTLTVGKYVKQSGPIPDLGPAVAAFQQPIIGTVPLPDGRAGQSYAASLFVLNGVPPYSWFVDPSDQSNFALSGLEIDMSGGIVRGTISPLMSGQTIKFRVVVRDNLSHLAMVGPAGTAYTINVK